LGQTVSGTLDSKTKPNDVYSIDLTYGQEILFTVHSLPNHTGNHMTLLTPSSKSIFGDHEDLASASTYNGQQTGNILYTPAVDGACYVRITAGGHNDVFDFTIAGSAETPLYPTSVYVHASRTTVSRGGKVVLGGSLVDQNLKTLTGRSVALQRSYDGKTWTTMQTLSASSGRYSATVVVSKSTWFRTTFAGDSDHGACVSRKLLVKAK